MLRYNVVVSCARIISDADEETDDKERIKHDGHFLKESTSALLANLKFANASKINNGTFLHCALDLGVRCQL